MKIFPEYSINDAWKRKQIFFWNLKKREKFVYPMIEKKALPYHSTFKDVNKQIRGWEKRKTKSIRGLNRLD